MVAVAAAATAVADADEEDTDAAAAEDKQELKRTRILPPALTCDSNSLGKPRR